ncbi:prephenate dehydratase [Flavobacterium oreochromis]|uniref:prephenate dehydratase n=1 Tax=Flavobacterium columnare TaxID=996 RepID=A0A246GAN9_9FLAO|nr:prephenate dehydratase [Flavobacterium oreochromis]OWP77201.1 prephenate dehydratase [Flavobacterium oreochromis]
MKITVAIQGIRGSFHQQVAQNYFGTNIEVVECKTFKEVAKLLKKGKVNYGVMAIENSIAGSLIPNYALIDENQLNVLGEYFLKISLNLMAFPGQQIEDIKEVHSHPIALLQCAKFLEKYKHIKVIESSDTAITAKKIKEEKLKGIAALAGPIASEVYDLEILAREVQSVESSITRFMILEKTNSNTTRNKVNKASVKFELDNRPGGLATVLNVMNNCKLNLTKIQSMSIVEKPFQYSFFVDVVFEEYNYFEKAKSILELMTTHFKLLGEYQSGHMPINENKYDQDLILMNV